jgi:hypothetical protein
VPPTSATATPRHAHSTGAHHGINVGWLAACIGLIALATALGHPDGTRRAAASTRAAAVWGRNGLGVLLRTSRTGGSS